jgi:hypothetical protein
MPNETVEEFLARGGKIREVCKGGADRLIDKIYKKPWKLNSRYHHEGNFVSDPTLTKGLIGIQNSIWANHSRTNKGGCKIKKRKK